MNRITSRAVQVMVGMMRDLMERVMDEAATCADSNGRHTIGSESIRTGATLTMQKSIDVNGGGCPEIKKGMASFACKRYAAYHDYLFWEEKHVGLLMA